MRYNVESVSAPVRRESWREQKKGMIFLFCFVLFFCFRSNFRAITRSETQVTHTILYFRIPHNTLCLPPQILRKPLFLNAPGSIAFSQEHFKTINYAKFGGQTECIMGDSKIVNGINNTWTNC